jgi:hypothetical protein
MTPLSLLVVDVAIAKSMPTKYILARCYINSHIVTKHVQNFGAHVPYSSQHIIGVISLSLSAGRSSESMVNKSRLVF